MALNTSSIEKLTDDRVDRLREHEPIAEISDAVTAHLTDIAVLRRLRGPAQIEAYDETHATPWNHAFVRATRDTMQRYLRGGKAERFQRVFTPEDLRVVPALPQHADSITLEGFVVSPDRVPGILLVKMGFVREEELHELNGDEIGRLIVKHDLVDSVRALFETATPIGPKQGRLLRVNPPDGDVRSRYPEAVPPKADAIGSILYVRGKDGGEKSADLQVHVYDNAYDALRKTFHADSTYDGEVDALAQCQRELDSIRSRLDRGYRRDASDEVKAQLWEQAEEAVARAFGAVRNARATEKVEARGFLAEAPAQRTKTGRPNVSPAMAKITAALRRIENRFTEIRQKGGFNTQDRIILHEAIRGDEQTLLAARHEAIDLATDVAEKKMEPRDARGVLELRTKELGNMRVRPLSVFANAMNRQIQMLDPDNAELFNEQLLRVHVIGKIQAIRTSAERIRGNAAKKGSIDFGAEARIARQVEDAVGAEQMFPGMNVPDIEHVMEPLCERWSRIREFLETNAHTPPADADEAKKALEELLDHLGTENAAQALVSWLPEAAPYEAPYALTNSK
jgi:hypothetical protein